MKNPIGYTKAELASYLIKQSTYGVSKSDFPLMVKAICSNYKRDYLVYLYQGLGLLVSTQAQDALDVMVLRMFNQIRK